MLLIYKNNISSSLINIYANEKKLWNKVILYIIIFVFINNFHPLEKLSRHFINYIFCLLFIFIHWFKMYFYIFI